VTYIYKLFSEFVRTEPVYDKEPEKDEYSSKKPTDKGSTTMGGNKSKKSSSPAVNVSSSDNIAVSSISHPLTDQTPTLNVTPAPTQAMVQQTVPMAIIPRAELDILLVTRNQLIEENSSLKSQLSRLLNEAQESYIRTKQKDIEIEELRRENEHLRKSLMPPTPAAVITSNLTAY